MASRVLVSPGEPAGFRDEVTQSGSDHILARWCHGDEGPALTGSAQLALPAIRGGVQPDDTPARTLSVEMVAGQGRTRALGSSLMSGLGFGLVGGLLFGLVTIQARWLAFVLASLWLGARRRLPFDLMGFLDDAYRLGLLRVVGPVYQFRHAALQDHLVPPSETTTAATANLSTLRRP